MQTSEFKLYKTSMMMPDKGSNLECSNQKVLTSSLTTFLSSNKYSTKWLKTKLNYSTRYYTTLPKPQTKTTSFWYIFISLPCVEKTDVDNRKNNPI